MKCPNCSYDLLPEPVVTSRHAAKMFDVTPATIREWIKSGKLKGTRVNGLNRIPISELRRVAEERYG